MLPTPEIRPWSSSWRLTPDERRRTRATNSSSSNSGSSGSRAMCAISGGRSAPPAETDRPPNIRWSAKRSSTSGVSRTSRIRRCRSAGASGGWTRNWPLMPRCPSSASPLSSGSQRYLPRRRAPSIRRPASAAAKPSGPRGSRRTGRGCSTSTRVMVRPTACRSRPTRTTSTSGSSGISPRLRPRHRQPRSQPGRGHRGSARARRTPSPPRPARPPSWTGRLRCRRGARPRAPGR